MLNWDARYFPLQRDPNTTDSAPRVQRRSNPSVVAVGP